MNFLCIIPARSGSKGIKNKNLKKIKNKSLIELSYDIALKSKIFTNIVVSTDSKKYQNYLKKKIPIDFLRPKFLSGDNVTDLDLLKYEIKRYQNFFNKKFKYVCLLQPTSPARTVKDLRNCKKIIINNKFDAVWTISKINNKFHPIKILKLKNKKLLYFNKDGSKFVNRQSLEEVFIRNGIAYFFSVKTILKNKNILPRNSGYLIIKRKIANIDKPEDLIEARKILK